MKCVEKWFGTKVGAGSVMGVILLGSTTAQAQAGESLAAQEGTIHGGTLVLITYFVLFGLLALYFGWMMRRQSKIQRELEVLEERMDGLLS